MTNPTSFTYNTNGLLATKVDANGTRKSFTYDTSQRVTAVRYYVNSSGVEYTDKRVDYYWDTNPFDSGYSLNAVGRLTAIQYQPVSGTTVQEMYSYQPDGRLTKKRLRWKRGSTQQDLEASYIFRQRGAAVEADLPGRVGVTYIVQHTGADVPVEAGLDGAGDGGVWAGGRVANVQR